MGGLTKFLPDGGTASPPGKKKTPALCMKSLSMPFEKHVRYKTIGIMGLNAPHYKVHPIKPKKKKKSKYVSSNLHHCFLATKFACSFEF